MITLHVAPPSRCVTRSPFPTPHRSYTTPLHSSSGSVLCHTLPDQAPLLGPQPIPAPIPAQSRAARTTACHVARRLAPLTIPCWVAAPEEMKRCRPLCALACAGEKQGCVVSRDVVPACQGGGRGHCMVVAVVWTSWLVRNEGREWDSERRERCEMTRERDDAGKPECT